MQKSDFNKFRPGEMMSVATPRHDDLIYDVGMHKGEDTEFYLKKGFRVIAFEANPDLVRHCKQLFEQQLRDRRLTIIDGAIVNANELNQNGMVTFFNNANESVWGRCEKIGPNGIKCFQQAVLRWRSRR